jgi:hypothetical protein
MGGTGREFTENIKEHTEVRNLKHPLLMYKRHLKMIGKHVEIYKSGNIKHKRLTFNGLHGVMYTEI